jgi:small-conductance mechanosensitive channel
LQAGIYDKTQVIMGLQGDVDKVSLLSRMSEIEQLRAQNQQLSQQIQALSGDLQTRDRELFHSKMRAEVSEATKTRLIADVIADLADTEKEKFVKMAENVEFESAPKFKEKLETVKESYFPKTKMEETTSKDEVDSVAANEPAVEASSDAMAAYTAAITKNLNSLKN